jgi:hypothetical protein
MANFAKSWGVLVNKIYIFVYKMPLAYNKLFTECKISLFGRVLIKLIEPMPIFVKGCGVLINKNIFFI